MRVPTLLLALAVALGASGCLFDDCGNRLTPRPFSGLVVAADAAPAPDTLTVAFVGPASTYPEVRVRPLGDLPFDATGSGFRLGLDVRSLGLGTTAPRFETTARGDTVFVRLIDTYGPDALVRRVCSPAIPSLELTVTSLRVPAGVRHVRVTELYFDDPSVPPLPVARPAHRARPALLTA